MMMMGPNTQQTNTMEAIATMEAPPTPPLSPSTFYSPRITADLDNSHDFIEELLLGGDGCSDDDDGAHDVAVAVVATASPLVPVPLAQSLNTSTAPAPAPYYIPQSHAAFASTSTEVKNAVHMECQENAKLPTFNIKVDRSNASWQVPAPRGRRSRGGRRVTGPSKRATSIGSVDVNVDSSTATAANNGNNGANVAPASPIPKLRHSLPQPEHNSLIDELMRLDENDMTLSESFLDDQDSRSSAALAYSYSKSGMEGGIPKLPPASTLRETTPIVPGGKSKTSTNTNNTGVAAPAPGAASFRPMHPMNPNNAKLLPYNRQTPLPIPTLKLKKPSPPRQQPPRQPTQLTPAALAIATAAAIATRNASTSPHNNTINTAAGSLSLPGGMDIDQQTAAALSVQPTVAGMSRAHPVTTSRAATNSIAAPKQSVPISARVPGGPVPPHLAHRPAPIPASKLHPPPINAGMPKPGAAHPPRPGPPIIPPPRPAVATLKPGIIPIAKAAPPHHQIYPYGPGHPYFTAQAQAARARQLAAHSKTKNASIAHAAAQRSKFGFGGDHKVPSVPAPPPVKGYSVRVPVPGPGGVRVPVLGPGGRVPLPGPGVRMPVPGPGVGKAGAVAPMGVPPATALRPAVEYKPIPIPNPLSKPPPSVASGYKGNTYIPSTSPGGMPKDVGTVVAYERKKQRAKDARVRLNESIEELAISIDLAGSQSKERFNYITNATGTNRSHMKSDGTPPPGAPQHPLARLCDETIQQAGTAKKWDRPLFVGLSACVIRSLNAQCEGLMREVARLRKLARHANVRVDPVMPMMAVSSMGGPPVSNGVNGVHVQPNGVNRCPPNNLPGHVAKKQKLDSPHNPSPEVEVVGALPSHAAVMAMKEHERCVAIRNTVGTPNLLKNIASFLDPASLCKCLCVSKRWRIQNIFQNAELWINLCLKRFGASAVRTWQDHEDDGGATVRKQKNDYENHTNLILYRRMSSKNVKPYCPMEGTVFLGGSTLDGLVSCWASLVDRSNGETSRSVMREKVNAEGQTAHYYGPIPVVELRLLIQNTGYSEGSIIIPDQQFSIDASTRRKGEKMLEVAGDDRFKRQILHIERRPSLDGNSSDDSSQSKPIPLAHEMCHLRLYESAVLAIHIHARGCSTTAKFCNRSKKIQLLVSVDGTTRPLAIPFVCKNEHESK